MEKYPATGEISLAEHRAAQAGRPPVSIHCPYQVRTMLLLSLLLLLLVLLLSLTSHSDVSL